MHTNAPSRVLPGIATGDSSRASNVAPHAPRRGEITAAEDDSYRRGGRRPQTGSERVSRHGAPEPQLTPHERAERALTLAERTVAPTRQGGSWHRAGTMQQRAAVRSWASRDEWKAAVNEALATEAGNIARAGSNGRRGTQHVVAAAIVQAVGIYLAERASGTGADVAVSHDTVARTLRISNSAVRRARRALARLGLLAVIVDGGYMTADERAEARARHGGRQLRCASTVALTHPPRRPADHLPRRGHSDTPNKTSRDTTKRAARAATAPRPQAGMKSRSRRRAPKPGCAPRWSIEQQRLAAALAQRLPWLDRGHVGHVCRAVENAGIDASRWRAGDLIAAMERVAAEMGRAPLSPGRQHSALAYFVASARFAVQLYEHAGWTLPSEDVAARHAAWQRRVDEGRRAVAAAEAERQRIANDPDNEAAYAEFRRQFPKPIGRKR